MGFAVHQRGERAAHPSGPVPERRWAFRLWERAQELLSVARVARRSLLTLLILAILAGCGGAAEPVKTAATPDPAQGPGRDPAARRRVRAAHDGRRRPPGLRAVHPGIPPRRRRAGQGGRHRHCAEVISFYGEALEGRCPPAFAEQAADPKRVIVTVRGDHAAGRDAQSPTAARASSRRRFAGSGRNG